MKETVNNLELSLCETCLERGRERVATHKELQMCDDCFNGKPASRDETVGERSGRQRNAYERQLERVREWRRKNPELARQRQRIYKARWRARQGRTKEA